MALIHDFDGEAYQSREGRRKKKKKERRKGEKKGKEKKKEEREKKGKGGTLENIVGAASCAHASRLLGPAPKRSEVLGAEQSRQCERSELTNLSDFGCFQTRNRSMDFLFSKIGCLIMTDTCFFNFFV